MPPLHAREIRLRVAWQPVAGGAPPPRAGDTCAPRPRCAPGRCPPSTRGRYTIAFLNSSSSIVPPLHAREIPTPARVVEDRSGAPPPRAGDTEAQSFTYALTACPPSTRGRYRVLRSPMNPVEVPPLHAREIPAQVSLRRRVGRLRRVPPLHAREIRLPRVSRRGSTRCPPSTRGRYRSGPDADPLRRVPPLHAREIRRRLRRRRVAPCAPPPRAGDTYEWESLDGSGACPPSTRGRYGDGVDLVGAAWVPPPSTRGRYHIITDGAGGAVVPPLHAREIRLCPQSSSSRLRAPPPRAGDTLPAPLRGACGACPPLHAREIPPRPRAAPRAVGAPPPRAGDTYPSVLSRRASLVPPSTRGRYWREMPQPPHAQVPPSGSRTPPPAFHRHP